MQAVSTRDLELNEGWVDSDAERCRVRFTFPINAATGADDSAVVYFELEPGKRLATHTDSAEEILYIVSGTAIAYVGVESGRDENKREAAHDSCLVNEYTAAVGCGSLLPRHAEDAAGGEVGQGQEQENQQP